MLDVDTHPWRKLMLLPPEFWIAIAFITTVLVVGIWKLVCRCREHHCMKKLWCKAAEKKRLS